MDRIYNMTECTTEYKIWRIVQQNLFIINIYGSPFCGTPCYYFLVHVKPCSVLFMWNPASVNVISQWYYIYPSSGRVYVSASPKNYDALEMKVTTSTTSELLSTVLSEILDLNL